MKAVLLVLAAALPAAADVKMVTVSAGDYDRRNTVVSFRGEAPGGRDVALTGSGKSFPLQVNDDGTASFVLDELGKGKELELTVEAGSRATRSRMASRPNLNARWDKARVKAGPGGAPWLEYEGEPSALPRANIWRSLPESLTYRDIVSWFMMGHRTRI
jgi:hypothetical protein